MAKNYSIAEAVQIIAENADTESIMDLGKRYPLLANKITRVAVLAGEDFVDFARYLPEHVSANKVNKAIKDAEDAAEVDEDEDAEDSEDEEEVEEAPKKPAKKAKEAKVEKAEKPAKKAKKAEPAEDEDGDSDSDYDSMSNKELWTLLGQVGGRKKCREEFGDTKTPDMIKYFKKYYPNGVDAEQPEEAEEEPADEYEGKSAVELYKMCKTRKIKAEQKKPAKYYIDLLKKAEADAAKSKKKAEPEEDEEWDDEEEEPAPKKADKKTKAEKPEKKSKKPAKEEVEEEADDDEEDDDWEI